MKVKTRPWDAAEYLDSEEAIAAFLDTALEEAGDDPAFMAEVRGTIDRAYMLHPQIVRAKR